MPRFKGGSLVVLEMVLNITNEQKRFDYLIKDLRERNCYNASKLKSWLKGRGYIDKDKNLLKEIPTDDMDFIKEDIRNFRRDLRSQPSCVKQSSKEICYDTEKLYNILLAINKNYKVTKEIKQSIRTIENGKHLIPFLKENCFINERSERLKPILLIDSSYEAFKAEFKKYVKRITSEKIILSSKVNSYNSEKETVVSLESFTDKQLVSELRKRGYDVNAVKTIEVKL